MLRSLARFLTRLLLGPAAQAGRQELDAEARLAIAPRALENELQEHRHGTGRSPRRVRHLLVYDGGLYGATRPDGGPLGRPSPVATGGTARGTAVQLVS
jgi:hypothetical protein